MYGLSTIKELNMYLRTSGFQLHVSIFSQLLSIMNINTVTISCLFFCQWNPSHLLFLFLLLSVIHGFSFFCCSKTFLNAVSLLPIHPTYHNSQTNLLKLCFYPFTALHSISKGSVCFIKEKFLWLWRLLKTSPASICSFSLLSRTKLSSGQTSDFSGLCCVATSLCCVAFVPPLCYPMWRQPWSGTFSTS